MKIKQENNTKVGEDNYGHPTAIVGGKKVLRGLKKAGVMGVVFSAVFLAVWGVMPTNGVEVAN